MPKIQQPEQRYRPHPNELKAPHQGLSEHLVNLSSEIRIPLNGIIGMTELTLETPLTPQQRDYLTLVKASADDLLAVINGVLDFSKIETDQFEIDPIAFDLRDSLGYTMGALPQKCQKNIFGAK